MKKITSIAIKAVLLLLTTVTYAQWDNGLWTNNEANHWYFGAFQHISFATGSPQNVTGSPMNVAEGSASVSDASGNLLFYAGGNTIYNSNNQVMLNGTGIAGTVDDTSTQFGAIIPKPGTTGIYYLFTVSMGTGLSYSEIDMSLDGGLGGVTANKNISLSSTAQVEKITAVHHSDGQQVWVISHLTGSNQFVAYLVTATGINTTPVTSAIGYTFASEVTSVWYEGGAGQIKASPLGNKLACNIYGTGFGALEIFDFNNTTGVISNLKHLDMTGHPYGVEFSPNGELLYVSNTNGIIGGNLLQFNPNAADATAIAASQILLGTFAGEDSNSAQALQLAPNGKIYMRNVISGNKLGVINYPNNAGTFCGYQGTGYSLAGGGGIGLPTFIQSFFESGILYEEGCPGTVAFSLLRIPGPTTINWNFGDPDSGTANTSTTASHSFSAPGTYTVIAQITSNGGTQTASTQLTINAVYSAVTPTGLTACAGPDGTAVFNLTTQTATILGSLPVDTNSVTYYTSAADAESATNAIAPANNFTSVGQTIYARAASTAGCYDVVAFTLTVNQAPVIVQAPDLQVCATGTTSTFNLTSQNTLLTQEQAGFTVTYYTSQADAEAGTAAITTPQGYTNTGNPQTIYAVVTNIATGCHSIASFAIEVFPVPQITQPSNLQVCSTTTTTAFNLTSQDGVITQGQTGLTVTYYSTQADADAGINAIATPAGYTNISSPQTIYVRVSNANCFTTATFEIEVLAQPVAAIPANLQSCDDTIADGFTTFDLTVQNNVLINSQDNVTASYYTSQADADAGTGAITSPEDFINTQNPQTIYARVSNTNGCFATAFFTVEVNQQPIAPIVNGLQTCNATTGSLATFDLTAQDTALINGQSNITLAYFTEVADAEANTNAISTPEDFTAIQNPQTIYARLTSGGCYAITSFEIKTLNTPALPADLAITGCPPFDITTATTQQSGITYSYYTDEADAEAAENSITAPAAYVPDNNNLIVYIRAENSEGCFSVAPLAITAGDCRIQKGISPNNDGKNDEFDLSGFDVNKLSIFNRYGLQVYSYTNYTSQWHGQQDNGNELPTGTYFYMIQSNNGDEKTGWIYINR